MNEVMNIVNNNYEKNREKIANECFVSKVENREKRTFFKKSVDI